VELALTLPLVCLLLLAVVQLAVVVADLLAVQLAAREGARAASVSMQPVGAARGAAEGATALQPLQVRTVSAAGAVTVRVTYIERTTVPLIGALVPDITVSASATMQFEPP
jgi:hypothetical protein